MQNSNSTHFKIINTHLILAMLFSIITAAFLIFNTNTLTAHANSNIGEVGSDGKANMHVIEGPSASKQFWLLCITDAKGTRLTDVVMLATDYFVADKYFLQTRSEHGSKEFDRVYIGSDFGWSYDGNGDPRGDDVGEWMRSYNSDGNLNMANLVYNLWGETVADAFVTQDWYLCLENGMWCGFYKNGEYSGERLAATSYGWALYNQVSDSSTSWEESGEKTGDKMIALYSNDLLPHSSLIDFAQTGLAYPTHRTPGKMSNEEIKSAGYGCGIFWVEDGATHTWDSETHPSDEGPAPEPPTGGSSTTPTPTPGTPPSTSTTNTIYTIIKSYRLKTPTGYEDKGTYVRNDTVARITIEDEPLNSTDKNYKVIGWKQSSTKDSSISSLTWETSVPQIIGETGSSAGFTTLDLQHKILYL